MLLKPLGHLSGMTEGQLHSSGQPLLLHCQDLDICVPARGQSASHQVLISQLSWQIHAGECWAVLGCNGAGKSTLLRALNSLHPCDMRCVRWQSRPLSAYSARQCAQHIGLMLQQSHTGLQNTALELVLTGTYPHHTGWYRDNAADQQVALCALADVGLSDKVHTPLAVLSGGELRRAELARLLVQNPALAMLDEPLNHLDISQQFAMLPLLQQRFQTSHQALVLVLHDLNLARHIASHCLLLFGDGRWQAGETATVATVSALSALMDHPLSEFTTPMGKHLSYHLNPIPSSANLSA
ncbi:MAG: ABC transporter ATP-binding protein [Pseudomonadota bacterium]